MIQPEIFIYHSPNRYTIYSPVDSYVARAQNDHPGILSLWLRDEIVRWERRGYEVKLQHVEIEACG